MRNRLIISALRPTWTWNICLKIQLHRPKAPQTNLHNISPHTLHHLGLNVAAEPQTHGYMSSFSLSSPSNLPPWEVSFTSQPCSCLTDHLFVCFVRKDWKEHKHTHTGNHSSSPLSLCCSFCVGHYFLLTSAAADCCPHPLVVSCGT